MKIKTVQIGFGNVARMHREAFPKKVKVVAIVEKNKKKRILARNQGFKTFANLKSAFPSLLNKIDFWDICVSTDSHFEVIKELLERGVKKILIEKPLCLVSEISKMENLLNKFSGIKISVQEQYISPRVVELINQKCKKYRIIKPKIVMELSKNRIKDIEKGRFTDTELGVFGYEVVHMLAAIAGTGNRRMPLKIKKIFVRDMILPSGVRLPKQGKGEISYKTEDGCEVKIYTSMDGKLFFPLPELGTANSTPYGDESRYRIIILKEKNIKIIGQFEPIPGLSRFQGRVLVYKGAKLRECITIKDNPMHQHLAKAIRFFEGKGENPTSPQYAILFVKFFQEVIKK